MKKFFIGITFLFFSPASFAYSWTLLCPDTIVATDVCFGLWADSPVIIGSQGFYIQEDDMEWHYYSYGLPVVEAIHYLPGKLLLAMGCGTYSDGIWSFDLETKDFEVMEWMFKPTFIRYYEHGGVYYAGTEEWGLYMSEDGTAWQVVDDLADIPCCDIDFYGDHVVVSEGPDNINSLHLSDDAGATWYSPVNAGYFSEVEFGPSGDLCAVFPGMSNSAGVYTSADFGSSWEPLIWEFFITTLGCDAMGNVFTGWDNGFGVAMVDPGSPFPEFTYLNDGLPDTHVHKVKKNPAMSSIAMFVCTDAGVYYSNDYMTGMKDSQRTMIPHLHPNPVGLQRIVYIQVPDNTPWTNLVLYDVEGRMVLETRSTEKEIILDLHDMQEGLYNCLIRSGKQSWIKKIVVN